VLGSGTHVHIGCKGGYCYLKFDAVVNHPQYIYKSGEMLFEDCKKATDDLLTEPLGTWNNEGNYKETDDFKNFEKIVSDIINILLTPVSPV